MPFSPAQISPAELPKTPLTEAEPKGAGQPAAIGGFMGSHRLELAGALLILIVGVALRVLPWFEVPDRLTEDEFLYIHNVKAVEQVGPFEYPAVMQDYVDAQSHMDEVILPPTRCMYILSGWAWDALFHTGPKMALRHVSQTFSILSLMLSMLFAFRLGGSRFALVVGALMAVSPMELMMAHRELVDGVFAFWTMLCLWLLWENLQRPGRLGWLAAYAGAIAATVMTKENAFFTAAGLGGVICVAAAAPKLQLGKFAWSTVAATVAGGVLGALVLVSLAGSVHTLIETYRLVVTKAEKMSFAYESGGGPWFRYIIDLMLVSPAVTLPAIGGIFGLRRENRSGIFLFLFLLFSCAVMVNVRNGMNLRYTTMWDMPMRYLAAGPILQIAAGVKRAPLAAAVALLALMAGMELYHYGLFFVEHDMGEPITKYLSTRSRSSAIARRSRGRKVVEG